MTAITDRAEAMTQERRYLRWAGFIGPFGPVIVAGLLAIRPFPYPDDGVDGRVYLDYTLPHYAVELQTLATIAFIGCWLAFVVLLAFVYTHRASGSSLPGWFMLCGVIVWAAVGFASDGVYMMIGMIARGYPGFGASPSDQRLAETLWELTNVLWAMGSIPLGIVLIAVHFANRAHPVLPHMLAGPGALVAAVASWASLASIFVPTGPWSPISVGAFCVGSGPAYLWMAATGLTLLRPATTSARLSAGQPSR
ncbi:hypothetical protein ACIP5Y_25110 [Nocardia sp. NPDC088792]|uniref:hypothetical protein n=1 Tax=Nocardia sp. NPDC088792 TaxID=3364332 RepID=UPI003823C747